LPALRVQLASGFYYRVDPGVTITIGNNDPETNSPPIALTIRACPGLPSEVYAGKARKLPIPIKPPYALASDFDILRIHPPTLTGLPSTIGRKFILTGLKLGSGSFGEVFVGFDNESREKARAVPRGDWRRHTGIRGYSGLHCSVSSSMLSPSSYLGSEYCIVPLIQ
jgi:hypothetical protein